MTSEHPSSVTQLNRPFEHQVATRSGAGSEMSIRGWFVSKSHNSARFCVSACKKPLLASDNDVRNLLSLAHGLRMPDWSKIIGLHGPLVWQTAWRLLNHEADAADCFQRAFVAALEISRREPIANWRPLLKRLATARALDILRQRIRRSNRQTALHDGGAPDARAIDPLRAAQNSELLEHLRECLADLDPRQSQVFWLACVENLSYDEIASQLDLTVNHVGVVLNRAKANLRERLSAHRPLSATEHSHEGT